MQCNGLTRSKGPGVDTSPGKSLKGNKFRILFAQEGTELQKSALSSMNAQEVNIQTAAGFKNTN